MKHRAVRVAVGSWGLALVSGVTTLTEPWSASDAGQADPEITSPPEVSPPADPLANALVVV